jgi:hypothetical protein
MGDLAAYPEEAGGTEEPAGKSIRASATPIG